MLVLKFGGTSVGSPHRMHELVKLIHNEAPKIVVLSAVSGTTNNLVEISNELYKKDTKKALDLISILESKYFSFVSDLFKTEEYKAKGKELIKAHFDHLRNFTTNYFTPFEEKAILAQGELLSTALFHYYLKESGIDSVLLTALDFMRLNEDGEPDLNYIEKNLQLELAKHPGKKLFITQGYICRNAFGEIDNLKRGGSDYTACLIGAALYSPEVQIWTDIDGMHNNDPRIVSKTFPVAELSFDEAAELAYFGAKILHPTCILPAQLRNIPVRLLNTMQPDAKGTVISETANGNLIKAVAAKDGIVAIKIKSSRMLLAYGFLRKVFEVFERYKKPIDMITTSEVAISLTVDDNENLKAIIEELEKFCSVEVEENQTIVCIVGDGLSETTGTAARVLSSLSTIPVRMISCGGSKNNITILMDSAYKKKALVALNEGIFNIKTEEKK